MSERCWEVWWWSWEVCGMYEGKWSVESGLVRIVVVFDTPFLWVLGGFWEVLFSTRLVVRVVVGFDKLSLSWLISSARY